MAGTPEKPLNELLSRSMVDLYVGPSNTHWILHDKLLCHYSPFFRKIFYSSSSKESQTKSFGLPDEEDAPFNLFIGWLYSRSIRQPAAENDLSDIFDLYLMAEKFQIQRLVEDVVDLVREWYRNTDTYPGLRRVQYIYAYTEPGSLMRDTLVSSVARMLALSEGIPQHWDKALRKNGQLAVDILLAIQRWRLEPDRVPDIRKEHIEEGGREENKGESEDNKGEQEDDTDNVGKEPGIKEEKETLDQELPNGQPNGVSEEVNGIA